MGAGEIFGPKGEASRLQSCELKNTKNDQIDSSRRGTGGAARGRGSGVEVGRERVDLRQRVAREQ